jgi:peroxiredoxin
VENSKRRRDMKKSILNAWLGCVALAAAAFAEQGGSVAADSQSTQAAQAVLERTANRYLNLRSYYFEGKAKMAMEMHMQGFKNTASGEIPGIIAVRKGDSATPRKSYSKFGPGAGINRIEVSDGAVTWVYLPDEKQYTESEAAPADVGAAAEVEGGDEEASAPGGMFGISRYERLPQKVKNPRNLRVASIFHGKGTKRPTPCFVLDVDEAEEEEEKGVTLLPSTLYIDTLRLLVLLEERRVKMVQYGQFDSMMMEVSLEFEVIRTDEELPDSLFAFRPPDGAKRVKEFAHSKRPNLKGKKAENFALPAASGEEMSSKDWKGKVVVLDFWASWCGPCRKAMPHLEKLHAELKDKGLVVVGVNTESQAVASNFMQKHGYTFTTLVDADGGLQKRYKVEAFPTVFVIGKDGKIVAHFVGAPKEEELRRAIAEAGVKD